MKQLPAIIGWTLLITALGLYLYGIYYAIFTPNEIKDKTGVITGYSIPEPLDTLVSTIGAILLTNLGAVLGISVSQPQSALAGKTLISAKTVESPMSKRELIQFIAVITYIVTLISCFITWAHYAFGKEPNTIHIVPLIQQYGKTLIGVITAYIAFVLGANKS